jgi:DNA-binding transcriptional MerR regulator
VRISELARTSGVALPTVKFYLREGLLPIGRRTAATQAEYDERHLARLRLVRALVDVGGLSLADVRAILAVLDADPDDEGLAIGTVHDAIGRSPSAGEPTRTAGPPTRALAAIAELGWWVAPDSSALHRLDAALTAVEEVGLPATPSRLRAYAQAALTAAREDVASIPEGSAAENAAYVVIGTVLYEPVLLALRRLAQQHLYATEVSGAPEPPASPGPLPGR